jgi:hypothetical protein
VRAWHRISNCFENPDWVNEAEKGRKRARQLHTEALVWLRHPGLPACKIVDLCVDFCYTDYQPRQQ